MCLSPPKIGTPGTIISGFKFNVEQVADIFDRLCQQFPSGRCSTIREIDAHTLDFVNTDESMSRLTPVNGIESVKTIDILKAGCKPWSPDYAYDKFFQRFSEMYLGIQLESIVIDLKTSCIAVSDGDVCEIIFCGREDRDNGNFAVLGFILASGETDNGLFSCNRNYSKLTPHTCPHPDWDRQEQLKPLLQYLSGIRDIDSLQYGTYIFTEPSEPSEMSS